MLADTSFEDLSTENYALFSYLNGQLMMIVSNGSDAAEFRVASADVSE